MGSHVTEESHLHINLLLYCSFLPLLHLSLLLNMQCPPNEIKINHMFIVWRCLARPPLPQVVLCLCLSCEGYEESKVYSKCIFCNKSSAFGRVLPLSLWAFCLFLYEPVTGPSVCFCLEKKIKDNIIQSRVLVCCNLY